MQTLLVAVNEYRVKFHQIFPLSEVKPAVGKPGQSASREPIRKERAGAVRPQQ